MPDSFSLDEAVPVLRRTPATLRALLHDLPESWLRANEGAGTWSPCEVVGHLIHGERTDWIPRVHHILEHGESKPFPPFNRDAMHHSANTLAPVQLLDEFTALRAGRIAELQQLNLKPVDLELKGTHPEFGTVTMGQHLAAWVTHDLSHLAQISRVMARQYARAAGPWSDYMPILKTNSNRANAS